MTRHIRPLAAVGLLAFATALLAQQPEPAQQPAKENFTDFIDATTGHRIIRLSPDSGGNCLYFHQNMYTPEGDKFLFKGGKGGIWAVDIKNLGTVPPKAELVLAGQTLQFAARKTREAYFVKGKGALWAVNVDTKAVREVTSTAKFQSGTHTALNCDETIVVAVSEGVDPSGKTVKPPPLPELSKDQAMRMFGDKIKAGTPLSKAEQGSVKAELNLLPKAIDPPPMYFTFTNLKTNETAKFYQYGWLNHIQFSPTDPNILMYCHEGTWHEVDRVWIVKTDGTGARLLSPRSMDMEISGHEFWSGDGQVAWWDHQKPRSKTFWVTGVNVYNNDRYSYHVERDEWSGHYNVNRDSTLFCGTGGGPGSVAFAENGQYIYAFKPLLNEAETRKANEMYEGRQVKYGDFQSEKLVDQKRYRNTLDSQVTLSPDNKWVIFASNMSGASHVYAVEIKKSK